MRRTALLATIALLAPLALQAQRLSPYDVLSFGDFNLHDSEINGRIAIGGSANFTSWGVGRFLPAGFSDYSLVVNHDLTSSQGGVYEGKTYIGGAFSDDRSGFPASYPPDRGPTTPSPVNFAAEQARFTALSNAYAALTASGMVLFDNDYLNFIGNSSYNVFTVSIDVLRNAAAGYEFLTPVGSTNIINVTGSSDQSAFYNSSFYFDCTRQSDASSCVTGVRQDTPADAAGVLFNFNDQLHVIIDGPVHGSILAPNTNVTFDGKGDVVGNVIVGSSTNALAEFYDNRDFGTTAAPEPATVFLFATGLAGVAAVARRRNRALEGYRVTSG